MKDRLIELLRKDNCCIDYDCNKCMSKKHCYPHNVADYLLKNGVIVPPCKVGDTVWYLNKQPHITLLQNSVYKAEVVRIVTTSLGTSIVIQIKSEGCCEIPDVTDWGVTLFSTREEAEKTLAENRAKGENNEKLHLL